MTKLKNISNGPRGLHTETGLLMVEPGQVVDVDLAKGEKPDKDWFADPSSKAAKATDAPDEGAADLAALKKQVADLTKQVEDLTKERDEATKANADLTKQVEDLTKPASK